jgi:hypothetical protein
LAQREISPASTAPTGVRPRCYTVAVKCAQSGHQGSTRALHPAGLDRMALIGRKTALAFPIR